MTSIRASLKRAYYSAVSAVHQRPLALNDTVPMVTFTFDDFPRSAYEAAGETLRAFGGHGTYYAAAGWMDGGPATGDRFRTADLPDLLRDGHELGTHTYSHVSCRSLSTAAFAAEIARGHKALHETRRRERVWKFRVSVRCGHTGRQESRGTPVPQLPGHDRWVQRPNGRSQSAAREPAIQRIRRLPRHPGAYREALHVPGNGLSSTRMTSAIVPQRTAARRSISRTRCDAPWMRACAS